MFLWLFCRSAPEQPDKSCHSPQVSSKIGDAVNHLCILFLCSPHAVEKRRGGQNRRQLLCKLIQTEFLLLTDTEEQQKLLLFRVCLCPLAASG